MIYQGKIIRIQANKALVETQKKTFKVSLPNVKLLHQEKSLVKSEFFSRDDSEPIFKTPRPTPLVHSGMNMNLFGTLNNNEQAFSIPKVNDSQNLSNLLKTINPSNTINKNSGKEFSMPLFPQNVSGVLDSLRLSSRNENSSKSDFPLISSIPSRNQNSSKFQSLMVNSLINESNPKKGPNHQRKPFPQMPAMNLSHSQPLKKMGLSNSLFTLAPKTANSLSESIKTKNGLTSSTGQGETQRKSSVIDNDLVNFAILFKLLQKKKKLAEMHDKLVKSRSESNLETNTEDLAWVQKSVTQIDKTLKNVWLSLKLRDTTITSKP